MVRCRDLQMPSVSHSRSKTICSMSPAMLRCWVRLRAPTPSVRNPRIRRSSALLPRSSGYGFCTIKPFTPSRRSASVQKACALWPTGSCHGSTEPRIFVRALLAAGLLIWLGSLVPAPSFAATVIKLRALPLSDTHPTPEAIASGSFDDQFQPFSKAPGHTYWRDYWLRVAPQDPPSIDGTP